MLIQSLAALLFQLYATSGLLTVSQLAFFVIYPQKLRENP